MVVSPIAKNIDDFHQLSRCKTYKQQFDGRLDEVVQILDH